MGFLAKIHSLIINSKIRHITKAPFYAVKEAEDKAKGFWRKLGPGLTTGAADDDPSGIATYSQTGAQFGNHMSFLAVFTYPLMGIVQEMCARIGLVTNKGLAANIRINYSKPVLIFITILLFIANTFNIGADLGAMAEATRLIFPNVSFTLLVVFFTILSLVLQIFLSYKTYAGFLKWLALILLVYVITAFTIKLDWGDILHSVFFPNFEINKESIMIIAAILGTTISPYLFFWQTSQEVEEKILHSKITESESQKDWNSVPEVSNIDKGDINDMRLDVWTGMFMSNLVMFFIIIVCSATLHTSGISNIGSAAEAAQALEPLAGNFAYLLFAIGIIGTGLLAVPVLAGSTSYAIAESFRWVSGLHHKLKEAYAFYGVITVSMIIGLLLNFIGLDPIKSLIYSAVVNCIVAPIVLIFIVRLSSRSDIMGSFINSKLQKIIGWIVVLIMSIVSIATIATLFI